MAKKNEKRTDERVEIFVPRAGEREDPNLQIAINGKTYLIPRGKKSLVPPAVAEEFERSERAADAWHTKRGSMAAEAKVI